MSSWDLDNCDGHAPIFNNIYVTSEAKLLIEKIINRLMDSENKLVKPTPTIN